MNLPTEFVSRSPEDTEKFAADFAKKLHGGDIVAFYGGLGAGKTCFVRGLAAGLGIDPYEVCSPTFALVNVYDKKLAHFDMYRISSADDVESTGFYEFDNIIRAVEWSENIIECIPKNAYKITITASESDETLRKITIEK